jgi:NAD(P)-dependent dehydrogenase (short-subunit alcohol dehydrogenase family)
MTESPTSRESPITQRTFDLRGKVILVSGASSGLGAHFTRVLHDAGATVVACARRQDRLDEVVNGLDRASTFVADLADADQRVSTIDHVLTLHGRLDVLVNNAGVSGSGRIEVESLDDFTSVLNLNLTALWHLSKLAGEAMVAQRSGSIVNIASVFGHVASAPMGQGAYVASKSAVVGLTKELGVQWARKGIRVNALCPGFFPSEMTDEMPDESKARDFILRETPMGRFGELDELDGPLLLLCSDASRFMIGASLIVDGGWSAR